VNLGVYWQVGANSQGKALVPGGILESPQLDDAAGLRVAGRIKVGQPYMVGASIHAVDNGVGCSPELIVETACDQAPDDRLCGAPLIEREIGDAPFDPPIGEPAVDTPDDVVALA
jgi:hypothetical protein